MEIMTMDESCTNGWQNVLVKHFYAVLDNLLIMFQFFF